jgi:hypothetical protein
MEETETHQEDENNKFSQIKDFSQTELIELTADIYAWLISIDMFEPDSDNDYDFLTSSTNNKNSISNFTINEKGNVLIEKAFSNKIFTGTFFPKLFLKLNSLLNNVYGNIYKTDERLHNIIEEKNSINSPILRLRNFEVILEIAKNYYGIVLDKDSTTLLVAGDLTTFCNFFERLYEFYIDLESKIPVKVKTKERKVETKKSNIEKLKNFNKERIILDDNHDSKHGNKGLQLESTPATLVNQESIPIFQSQSLNQNLPKIRFREDYIDLEELESNPENIYKPLTQTRSVLEFIILALARSFSMTLKQAVALLSDNKKYLTYLLIKGIGTGFSQKNEEEFTKKKHNNTSNKYENFENFNSYSNTYTNQYIPPNFQPVLQFYSLILSSISYLSELIEINSIANPQQISKNIFLSLSVLKPGLLSKNLEVVFLTGRVLTKLAFEFIERNLISPAWEWFIMPGGGLESCILCLKKHEAQEVVVSLLTIFGRFHLFELFSIYLRNHLQNEGGYFNFVSDIMVKLSNLKIFTDDFIKNGIKTFFFELIKDGTMMFNMNTKISCVGFVTELWINFNIYIEEDEENHFLLNTLKKFTRDENKLVQYCAIGQLFRILSVFAKERNMFAPVIYKTLTFNLIEHHNDNKMKEFIMGNFSMIFKLIMSIPVGILVEPYIKQVNISLDSENNFFNLPDINFIVTLCNHPRLNSRDAVLILDILGRIYFDAREIYFSKIVRSVFTLILARFLITEVGVEFCFKYSKILIETFCKLDKNNSDRIFKNFDQEEGFEFEGTPTEKKFSGNNILFENENSSASPNFFIQDENKLSATMQVSLPVQEFDLKEIFKITFLQMIYEILSINNTFINSIIKSLLISAGIRHFKIYGFYNVNINKAIEFFGDSVEILFYYNKNIDELDVDREFEILISLIYDRPPIISRREKISINKRSSSKNLHNNKNTNEIDEVQENMANLGRKINQVKMKREEILKLKNKYLQEKEKPDVNSKNKKQNKISPGKKNSLISPEINHNQNELNKNTPPTILDLSQEEDRDLISLKKTIKDYHRFFKFLFTKYCGSIYHPVQGKLFNSIKEIQETLAPSEIVKMFKEHDICGNGVSNHILKVNKENQNLQQKKQTNSYAYSYITKDEILSLITLVNTKIFKKENLKSGINLEEFIEIFVQISFYCFNRPPFYYKKFTISEYLIELINLFGQHALRDDQLTRKSSALRAEYIHPDELLSQTEKSIVDSINKQLLKDNNTILPNGYKKYLDTEIKEKRFIPDCMRSVLPQNQITCLEIFDEILSKAIGGVHFLESFVFVKEVYKVRPIHGGGNMNIYSGSGNKFESQELKLNLKNKVYDDLEEIKKNRKLKEIVKKVKVKKDRESSVKSSKSTASQKKGEININKEKLENVEKTLLNENQEHLVENKNFNIDTENSDIVNLTNKNLTQEENKFDKKSKSISKEKKINVKTINNLKTLTSSNSLNSNSLQLHQNSNKYILNQIKIEKILDEENKKLIDKEKEKKRKLRVQYIKQEIDRMKDDKKEKEAKRDTILNEERQKKEEKLRKKMEVEAKLREKIKSELVKIKQLKIEDEKKKAEEERRVKLQNAKKKQELTEVFNNQKVNKLKEDFKKLAEEKKMKNKEKKLEMSVNEKKLINEKKRFEDFLQREKKLLEEEKILMEKVEKLISREDVKNILIQYDEHIKLICEVYSDTASKSGKNLNKSQFSHTLNLDEFQSFCVHFNITNALLSHQELQFIFKKISTKNNTPGWLEKNQFIESLIYICLFSLENFKQIESDDEREKSDSNINIKFDENNQSNSKGDLSNIRGRSKITSFNKKESSLSLSLKKKINDNKYPPLIIIFLNLNFYLQITYINFINDKFK